MSTSELDRVAVSDQWTGNLRRSKAMLQISLVDAIPNVHCGDAQQMANADPCGLPFDERVDSFNVVLTFDALNW